MQRRFTRLIPGMARLSYTERMEQLALYTLEFRRMRGDLIETHKIAKVFGHARGRKHVPDVGGVQTQGPHTV